MPKIHCESLEVEDYSISFKESELQIPLQFNEIFSYFYARIPTLKKLYECEKVSLSLNSADWNPYCKSYERNEWSILNFEGNISELSRRISYWVIFEVEDTDMAELKCAIASITNTDWETNIDLNISLAFIASTLDE